MTDFEQTLLQEISTLPEARRADVLAYSGQRIGNRKSIRAGVEIYARQGKKN
jgi:hypothetical protein